MKNGEGIGIEKVDSAQQVADIFTKGLPEKTFKELRKILVGW